MICDHCYSDMDVEDAIRCMECDDLVCNNCIGFDYICDRCLARMNEELDG